MLLNKYELGICWILMYYSFQQMLIYIWEYADSLCIIFIFVSLPLTPISPVFLTEEYLWGLGRHWELRRLVWPTWCVTFKQSASLVTLKVADEFAFAPLLLTYRYLLIIKLHQFVGMMIPLWKIIPAQWTLSAIKIFALNFIVCLGHSSFPGPFITFIRLTLWREWKLCN